MSKFKTFAFCAFALLLSVAASAQDYTFKVISKKGSAKANGVELKVGSKVNAGQTIAVGQGTLLNIAHKNGKTLNISRPGAYKVDVLAKGVAGGGNSLTSKYANFVMKELTTGKSGVSGRNMRKPGSVTRNITEKFDFAAANVDDTQKPMDVATGKVTLKWHVALLEKDGKVVEATDVTPEVYTFKIYDLMGTELFTADTKESSITVDLSGEKYTSAVGGKLMYEVIVNNDTKLKTPKRAISLNSDNAEEVAMLSEDNTALGKLILAKYFEDKGLFANAMYAYESALEMSSQDEMYKNMYQAFLDRNYLTKKSKKKLKEKSAN